MLKGLLEKKTCSGCRICCGFDNTDLWELPVMTKKTADRLAEIKQGTKFVQKDGGYITDAGNLPADMLYYCPALDHKTGCMLEEDKPFDCRIWPFRVMETKDKRLRMITVSPVCPEIYGRPLSDLAQFVNGTFKDTVFRYAAEHPEIIKPYIENYPVLALMEINK